MRAQTHRKYLELTFRVSNCSVGKKINLYYYILLYILLSLIYHMIPRKLTRRDNDGRGTADSVKVPTL